MNKNQITVRVTDKLDKAIGKASQAEGLTKASWIRQLIIWALQK